MLIDGQHTVSARRRELAAGRLDVPDKVFGRPRFVQDHALPGMLHGRILRPPSPGATLTRLDAAKAKAVPGVGAAVRDGSFVGILAGTEDAGLPLLAAARYLAAHATTTRSQRQTFDIALRLHRGERLYEEADV